MTSAPHEDIPAGPRVPLRALKRRRGPSPAAGTHRQQHRNGKPGRGDALGPVAAGWHDPEGRLGTRDPFLPLTCAGTRLQTRRPLAGLGSAGSGSVQLLLSLFNKPAWREARPHAAVLLIANRLPWPSRGPGTGRRGQRPSVRPSVRPPLADGRPRCRNRAHGAGSRFRCFYSTLLADPATGSFSPGTANRCNPNTNKPRGKANRSHSPSAPRQGRGRQPLLSTRQSPRAAAGGLCARPTACARTGPRAALLQSCTRRC